MNTYRLLILTDHSGHSEHNSLYELALELWKHPACASVDIASRGLAANAPFFQGQDASRLWVLGVDAEFCYSQAQAGFQEDTREVRVADYNMVFLRMPPPLPEAFLHFLDKELAGIPIANAPKGIHKAGSKEFLLQFPELCPPMRMCHSVEDIIAYKQQFPIVLKPLREYGGKGLVRIDDDTVWMGNQQMPFATFVQQLKESDLPYLAVKFMRNVGQGDKRIVVVAGKIMGASVRFPAQDSWLCNVAMGGSSHASQADADEQHIVREVHKKLSEMGIVMYGVDTLVGDDGKRILSELNTTSIGGLSQIAQQEGTALIQEAAHLIWTYFVEQIAEKKRI